MIAALAAALRAGARLGLTAFVLTQAGLLKPNNFGLYGDAFAFGFSAVYLWRRFTLFMA